MGTPGRSAKPQLTKAILEMKFMKKTKERLEKELETRKDHNELYSNIITDEMKNATGNFIIESSFLVCEELMEGRLSFKGMNPEIERLMEIEDIQKQPQDEIIKDIPDQAMFDQYQNYKRSREGDKSANYYKNNQHKAKKRKFDETT